MNISKTTLTKTDLVDLLIEYKNIKSDNVKDLVVASDENIISGHVYYPNYYFFKNINGKHYVLEDAYAYTSGQAVVYEVTLERDDEGKEVCKEVFPRTVGNWDIDSYEAHALYRIPIDIIQASNDATDVKVWIKYQCRKDDKDAPRDHYIEDGTGAAQIFPSVSEAEKWIAENKLIRSHLANNELGLPIYTVV